MPMKPYAKSSPAMNDNDGDEGKCASPYSINIQGSGPHHNPGNSYNDADKATQEAVSRLHSSGHQIHSATFSHTAKDGSKVSQKMGPVALGKDLKPKKPDYSKAKGAAKAGYASMKSKKSMV